MGLVLLPLSIPQLWAGKKRPFIAWLWFVLLSPHKSWWAKTSLQCSDEWWVSLGWHADRLVAQIPLLSNARIWLHLIHKETIYSHSFKEFYVYFQFLMMPARHRCSDWRKIWAFQWQSVMTFSCSLTDVMSLSAWWKTSKKEEMVYTYTVFSCISLLLCQTCDPWLAFSCQKKSSPVIKRSD